MNQGIRSHQVEHLIHTEHEESAWIVNYSRQGALVGLVTGMSITAVSFVLLFFSGIWLQFHLGLYFLWVVANMTLWFLVSVLGTIGGALYGDLGVHLKQRRTYGEAVGDVYAGIAFRQRLRLALLLRK